MRHPRLMNILDQHPNTAGYWALALRFRLLSQKIPRIESPLEKTVEFEDTSRGRGAW